MKQKTQQPVKFELPTATRKAVGNWVHDAGLTLGDCLFSSRLGSSEHLSVHRIVNRWCRDIDLDASAYRTHSMLRTKATLIYRRAKNLRAVQLLLGHSKLENTIRYLGVKVQDALEIYEQTEI